MGWVAHENQTDCQTTYYFTAYWIFTVFCAECTLFLCINTNIHKGKRADHMAAPTKRIPVVRRAYS